MLTLLLEGGFRFFFYSNEGREPPHVHVEKGGGEAKLWLQPVALVWQGGLTSAEVRRVRELAFQHQASFLERWHEHFGRQPGACEVACR